jgi:hypothetical protein
MAKTQANVLEGIIRAKFGDELDERADFVVKRST